MNTTLKNSLNSLYTNLIMRNVMFLLRFLLHVLIVICLFAYRISPFFRGKNDVRYCSRKFKRFMIAKENFESPYPRRILDGRERGGLLNLTLQELGTLKRDWQYQAEYISGITPSKQPLSRMRDIPFSLRGMGIR